MAKAFGALPQLDGRGARPTRAHAPFPYNFLTLMKAYVYVSLKKSVLDPQGKTIHGALAKMGYKSVADVRQGKYFEIVLDGMSLDEAKVEVERMAREVLTNTVIEEYRFVIEE